MAPQVSVLTSFRHRIVAIGVRTVLTAHDHISVVAECTTLGRTLKAIHRHRPRVVIVGTGVCAADSRAVEALAQACPETRVAVFCTRFGDIPEHMRVEGASAVIPPDVSPDQLLDCVHALAAGRRWHAPRARLNGTKQFRFGDPVVGGVLGVLSPRERQIAQAVATGRRNREIAEAFGITPGTVKLHLNRIYAKVGVNSRLALWRKLVTDQERERG